MSSRTTACSVTPSRRRSIHRALRVRINLRRRRAGMSLRRRRDIWDLVVVGGGIGGLTAAWYASRRGLPTAVLESSGMLGGQVATVNTIDDWPSPAEVSGVELA